MATEGKAYFSESGMIFKTLEEAERQDKIDREENFVNFILRKLKINKSSHTYLMFRDSTQIVYEHPEVFIEALMEFGFIKTEELNG